MDPSFKVFVESLEPKFYDLVSMQPIKYNKLPPHLPKKGLYLFSEGDNHLYVGRTNRLRERLREHCMPSGTHFSATFAFRIARQQTGYSKATYKTKLSRPELVRDSVFGPAFEEAKKRVSTMDIRFIEETSPISQALLEIYVATVLHTPYNDFENH
jgi:hypothetical protein